MFTWALKFLYLIGIILISTYAWGQYISESSQYFFGFGLSFILLGYQIWKTHELLEFLIKGELIPKKQKGLGNWREIYYLLDKLGNRWSKKLNSALNEQEKFIQAIQASPNGVLMLDHEDHIEWCNAVSERHLGLNSKRDAMQKVTYLIRNPLFTQYIQGNNYQEPITMDSMGVDGTLSLSIQIFPFGGSRKLVLSQDITQSQKNEAMRRDFVANVSHELRTPLTVLSGFLETVRELHLNDEDRKRYLDLMYVQSERMTALVEDLLILTRLESSPPPLTPHRIDTSSLFNKLIADAQGLSAGKHKIETDFSAQLDIQGDEKEIYSAFGNLITNAIRYTPEGGVVRVSWLTNPQGSAIFSVADSGPGIAAEHLPRLTERFYRVDRSRSRDTGGTGLGLAIVKHIVTRHQANLNIQSEVGRGSTFSIEFPESRLQEKTHLS